MDGFMALSKRDFARCGGVDSRGHFRDRSIAISSGALKEIR